MKDIRSNNVKRENNDIKDKQPISAQENPSGKKNIDIVFNFLNIYGNSTSLKDLETTYGMFFV